MSVKKKKKQAVNLFQLKIKREMRWWIMQLFI